MSQFFKLLVFYYLFKEERLYDYQRQKKQQKKETSWNCVAGRSSDIVSGASIVFLSCRSASLSARTVQNS